MRVPGWGLLLVFALGVAMGWQTHAWKSESEIQAAGKKHLTTTLRIERAETAASAAAGEANAASLQGQQEKVRIIKQEVIRYVKSPDADRCTLSAHWLQLHDQAAGLSRPAEAAGPPAAATGDTAAAATDSEALQAVTDNYAICAREIERLRGWQDWYRSVSDAAH